jgi:hypothetical protein
MGRITYGRVTEVVDLPRPVYDEQIENGEFKGLTERSDKATVRAEKPTL